MSEPIKNIVLVGRTGNGKSTTGNTIIGEKMFFSKQQAGGVTMNCKMYRAAIQNGPVINVIDTPGLFDLTVSADNLSREIINCLDMAEEGIHAVLFVLSTRGRITQEEESTLHALQRIFGSKILDYFIVVFTGGDGFENGETLDDYLRDNCPEFLKKTLRLCHGRKVLFDNKTKDNGKKANQLKQLVAHMTDVQNKTSGKPYTHNVHRKIKEKNEQLGKQERDTEWKKRVEPELAVTQGKFQKFIDVMLEKLRMDHDIYMQIQLEKQAKNLAEAKKLAKQEQLRMEHAKKEMIALVEENKQLGKQERDIEYKKRVEAELAEKYQNMQAKMEARLEKLRIDHEKNIQIQMENQAKNLAEAKKLAKQEQLRMEHAKKEMIALVEEDKRLREENQRKFESSKKKYMVYARNLGIAWSDNSQYWSWVPLRETLGEAALLKMVCWLAVNGTFDTRELTPGTKYEVVYVVKLENTASGWETPVNLKLTLARSGGRPQEHSVRLKDHIGRLWVDIPAGEFIMSPEIAGEISFSMYEIASGSWKRGLCVKGVEIRPKN